MCGRFTIQYSWAEYYDALNLIPSSAKGRNDPPRYNVTPAQSFGTLINSDEGYEVIDTEWGLLPFWAKNKKFKPINARGETVAEKPMFKVAFKHKRCLIPADSYYEWIEPEPKKKLPFNIHLPDREPFFFAGVWASNDTFECKTSAIITLSPTDNIKHIHDRMPVILKLDACEEWLDQETSPERALELLQRNRGADLTAYSVSTEVNSNKAKGAQLLEPVES